MSLKFNNTENESQIFFLIHTDTIIASIQFIDTLVVPQYLTKYYCMILHCKIFSRCFSFLSFRVKV